MLSKGIQLGIEMGAIAPVKKASKKAETRNKVRKAKSLIKRKIIYKNVKKRGQM